MNRLLYGHNTDERIVAVYQKGDSTMRVYFRDAAGVRHEDQEFFPFFHLADERYLEGFPKKHWVRRLEGTGYYQYLCVFQEWPVLWEAIRRIIDRYNRSALTKAAGYQDIDLIYLSPDPVTQYLMQTGRTLFKGMNFDQVYRMQLDIETYTSPPFKFSNATRAGDRIILIALSDNRGWEHMLDGKRMSESQMLHELVAIITDKDPDVIEGHNIYGFDLPYILKRCELNKVPFDIGRDGTAPRTFDTRTAFAERAFAFTAMEVPGRHIADTLLLVQSFDTSRRDMDSYSLKYAAQYFGFASPERTYIPSEKISWHWDHEPEKLKKYAFDDVNETKKLSDLLSGPSFYLSQMLPFNFGHVIRLGSAAKIESLIVREYVREKHALPKPGTGTQTTGGYTDVFAIGILGPIVHVDVESLYPSVMISKGISPATDAKNIFQELLKTLTEMRLEMKRSMKHASSAAEKASLDARQSSLKILINSFYGYLGYSRGLFNDFSQADVVTKTGQAILRQMISHIQSAGGKVVEVDTDGVFFVPPPGVTTEDSENEFVQDLARQMPEGIAIALDGRYRKMLSYKKKNYALLGYDHKIKIKGSSLTSRSIERFGRSYIMQCIDCLLSANVSGLHTLYTELHHAIVEHKLDVMEFARVETLKDPLTEYTEDVALGKRNKSAAYEVALTMERAFRPGDRVAYYIIGTDPNPRSFDHCKPADVWDPNFPDENVAYYLRRLDEFSEKFQPFFSPQDYRAIFSADDLFPFNPAGITPLTVDVADKQPPASEDTPPPEPGIWLDE